MRPRIQKSFGIITFKELNEFLNENNCWGITGKKVSPTVLEYMYVMMFRNLHESKYKKIKVTVSRTSKLVIGLEIEGKKFDNIYGFKKYVSIK